MSGEREQVPKQLLHLVFGGELRDLDGVEFRDLAALEVVGIFPNYAEALVAWKAASQRSVDNAAMAGSLGVRTRIVYAASSAVAVGLAAFGGIVGAELLPIEPYYALRYMVTFLVVVSVGGAGSIPGALLACLVLGAIDTTGRYLVPEYGEFFFYLAVITIVCLFPNGLLGRKR